MKFVLVILMVVNLLACAATPQKVKVPTAGTTPPSSQVSAGDQVRVVTADGKVLDFEVTQVLPEGIEGEGGMIPYSEMKALAVMRQDRIGAKIAFGILIGFAAIIGLSGAIDGMVASSLLDGGGG